MRCSRGHICAELLRFWSLVLLAFVAPALTSRLPSFKQCKRRADCFYVDEDEEAEEEEAEEETWQRG